MVFKRRADTNQRQNNIEWRHPMTLRSRLLLGYGTILAVVLGGFFLILLGVLALGRSPEQIVTKHYPSIRAADRMTQAVQAQQNVILRTLLSDEYDLSEALERAHKEFNAWLARARISISFKEEGRAIVTIEERYKELQELLADRSRWASVYPWETGVVDAFQRVIRACEELATLNFNFMLEANRNAHQRVQSTVAVAAAVATLTLLIGVWLALSLSRRLSKPLEQLVAGSREIAHGNYKVNIPGAGVSELSQLAHQFNAMAQSLQSFRTMDLERIINEQRLSEAVLQSIDDGLIIFDKAARIKRLNLVAARQLGLQPDQTMDRSLGQLLGDKSLNSAVRHCLGLTDAAEPLPQDLRIYNDGNKDDSGSAPDEPRYLDYSILPIIDEYNQRQGAVMVLRDITEHKAFDQMRTEFVMRASHELRTPVTSIRMGIGMLSEKMPFAEESREHELLSTVNEELSRLMLLVNDLFDLSKFQAGRQPLELSLSELPELLAAARQRFTLKAAEQQVALVVDCADSTVQARLDISQFNRVLDNLIDNALRYTPPQGQITLRTGKNDNNDVFITVSDTGRGIDYAHQQRVFEPFVQVSSSGDGAGLGLAMCKEIVQQHGGRITLRSAPQRGSTFTITLPA